LSPWEQNDVDEADCWILIQNPRTKIILMYIEGVREERGSSRPEAGYGKNSGGGHQIGAFRRGHCRRFHTGSLAGSDEIFDASSPVRRNPGRIGEERSTVQILVQQPLLRGNT